MAKTFTDDDDALLDELGVEVAPPKPVGRSQREERIVAGFEEIQRFADTRGRAPRHDVDGNIFERLYAVRLDRLRQDEASRALLAPLDRQELLSSPTDVAQPSPDQVDDEELLEQLGVESSDSDLTELRHVRSRAQKRAAEDIATRRQCRDFDSFRPLFEQVQQELDAGIRKARRFRDEASIEQGHFFILAGQKAYVAEKHKEFRNAQDRPDARLRVIFDNGTESNMLMRSLERALQKDQAGRRVSEALGGPLFADRPADGDQATGTIYVLRSNAAIPYVAENRHLVHKIGVTTAKVESRIAGAALDPTFLMADVEIAATYRLYNINRGKLEHLLHRIFDGARLDIEIEDRFGNPVVPREWFLVPLYVIDEAVEKIRDGTITRYVYQPTSASLNPISAIPDARSATFARAIPAIRSVLKENGLDSSNVPFIELDVAAQRWAIWCVLSGEGAVPREARDTIMLVARRLRDQGLAAFNRLRAGGPLYRAIAAALASSPQAGPCGLERPKGPVKRVRAYRPVTEMQQSDWCDCVVRAFRDWPFPEDDLSKDQLVRSAFETAIRYYGIRSAAGTMCDRRTRPITEKIEAAIGRCADDGYIKTSKKLGAEYLTLAE